MKAHQSRQHPAEWEESVPLRPQTARDLPAGRHQFHKERLMAHIEQDRQQDQGVTAAGRTRPKGRGLRLRPAFTLPVAALALAGAVIAGTVMNGPGGGPGALATGPVLTTRLGSATTGDVPQLLDRVSLVAAQGARSAVGPGQYVYIESQSSNTFVKTVGDRSSLASHALHRRQIWRSADGAKGWLIDPAVNDSPRGETLSLPDEKGNPFKASLNGPSYDYLARLTTDPDALLAKIYKETAGQGNTPDQQAFTTIGDLLGESYPPAALYPALFKAAARIPGVVVVDDAQDAIGRSGVAVARLDETSGIREEWIFDKNTHVFLGVRTVQVQQVTEEGVVIAPGVVRFTSAVTARAIVDGMKQTPGHGG
ncbi:CU044_5270 family protein [Streptomyces sp. NPDC059979]|uniref:CU044_5270 family protein n=1 Tax=unclassified Streptomyces TaxID=2593676 RepID=UPI0036590A34